MVVELGSVQRITWPYSLGLPPCLPEFESRSFKLFFDRPLAFMYDSPSPSAGVSLHLSAELRHGKQPRDRIENPLAFHGWTTLRMLQTTARRRFRNQLRMAMPR